MKTQGYFHLDISGCNLMHGFYVPFAKRIRIDANLPCGKFPEKMLFHFFFLGRKKMKR